MRFLRRVVALGALVSAEIAAVVVLHQLGGRAPFDLPLSHVEPWLRAEPVDALAAALRVVALVSAWWLLALTIAYSAARLSRLPSAIRVCEHATPRLVRRVVDAAFAASIVVGVLASPASAATDPGPRVEITVRDGHHHDAGPVAALPTEPSTPSAPASAPVAASAQVPARQPAPDLGSVEVAPGDSLWGIAADALARATGRERHALTDEDVAPYWERVCARNRDALRSGDVNLIYPGETVVLPSPT